MSKWILSATFLLTVLFAPAVVVEKPVDSQPAKPYVLDPGY